MDISERKKQQNAATLLEEQTRRADRYESLGVLAAGVAHDFNNLLVPILGGAEHLAAKLGSDDPLRHVAEEIAVAAAKAARRSSLMQAYSGSIPAALESTNLSKFIESVRVSIDSANNKNAKLNFEILCDHELTISSNPVQLRQVVHSLFDNALEAVGDDGGQVSVRIGERYFRSSDLDAIPIGHELTPGELPFIEIEDNGEGVAPSSMERVFDPFYTTRFAGRGLGLAVVAGIVKNFGGGIHFESSEGTGTKVTVVFPRASNTKMSLTKTPPAMSLKDVKRNCVLVIDDEVGVRTFIAAMLAANGYESLTAAGGIEGIKIFQQKHQKIMGVILDLTMPDMDGDEVLDCLLEIQDDVAVLITSGFAKADVMKRVSDSSTRGFLSKPFREHELLASLKKLEGS